MASKKVRSKKRSSIKQGDLSLEERLVHELTFELQEPAIPIGLTDADWSAINELKAACKRKDGSVRRMLIKLGDENPRQYMRIFYAYFPDLVANILRDEMAEMGMTREDLEEKIRKAEGSKH